MDFTNCSLLYRRTFLTTHDTFRVSRVLIFGQQRKRLPTSLAERGEGVEKEGGASRGLARVKRTSDERATRTRTSTSLTTMVIGIDAENGGGAGGGDTQAIDLGSTERRTISRN